MPFPFTPFASRQPPPEGSDVGRAWRGYRRDRREGKGCELTITGQVAPPRMMEGRLAPDRSLIPALSQWERESRSAFGAYFRSD